jgi:hypothetical protein
LQLNSATAIIAGYSATKQSERSYEKINSDINIHSKLFQKQYNNSLFGGKFSSAPKNSQ